MRTLLLTLLLAVFVAPLAADMQAPGTLAARTAGLQRVDGFIPFYLDQSKGRILFELSHLDEDVLYYVSYATSPGSVELGMDRGVTRSAVVRFERTGPRVLVVQRNLRYRALGGPDALAQERRGLVRAVGARGAADRSRGRRTPARGRHAALHARLRWSSKPTSAGATKARSASIPTAAASGPRARRRSRRTPKWKSSPPTAARIPG